ncbi:hypothetical protein ACVBEJ_08865 [Porticoccus sp. GXU_MW_L64]
MPEHEQKHHKAISELYQQSQEETMITRDLDDKILTAAKADLTTVPKKAVNVVRYSGSRRWSTPVAAAACLLLATSVGFNVVLYQQAQPSVEPQTARYADLAVVAPSPASTSTPKTAQARKKEALESRQIAAELREQRFSTGESDLSFETADAEEKVVVTGNQLSVDPQQEQRIEAIITLLENGELKQAEQALAMLLSTHQRQE